MKQRLDKIRFYDSAVGYENLWALPLGESHYCLESIPFFIYGIALGDIVMASKDQHGDLHFLTVIKSSKNRTLRARSDDLINDSTRRVKVVEQMEQMGCQVEIHRDRLLAINVQPELDLKEVTGRLTKLGLSWEYGSPSDLNS
jgi:hypothetical protein